MNLLLVDFNNIVLRGFFGNPCDPDDPDPNEGLIGFSNMLSSTITNHSIDQVVVCFDSKPYLREAEYPGYKGDRKRDKYNKDVRMQIEVSVAKCLQLVDICGLQTASYAGMEADDLIASIALNCYDRYESVIILSNDSDLNQVLVEDNIYISKKSQLYSKSDMESDTKITAEYWPLMTALVGSHNGVPGVKGIGPKTAIKMITAYKETDEIVFKGDTVDVELARDLATLPHWDLEYDSILWGDGDEYKEKNLVMFLASNDVDGVQPLFLAIDRVTP